MNNFIKIEDLRVEFTTAGKKLVAINNFSLSIKEFEFVSIVGLSGCGKTTILNLLAGYLKSTSGTILFKGGHINNPSIDRVVVFQEDAVFPWYSVRQNIEYPLKMKGTNKRAKRQIVDKYLDAVDLKKFADYYPKDLSGGMKKRVDLARAYSADPKMLLMDEPFGALDTYTRQEMQIQLLNLYESEKKTILFVTHDINEAIFLSDRIVLMSPSPGKVQEVFDIPFNRPRKAELKRTAEFGDLFFKIEDRLHLQEKANE